MPTKPKIIIEGNKTNPCRSCSGSKNLAAHLQREDTNENVRIMEIKGLASEGLEGAFVEMNVHALLTRATKAAYHAKICPSEGVRFSEKQAFEAVEKLEKELGFDDQARVVVRHEKHGREHYHVVWSRTDLERERAIDTPNNYEKHEKVAAELEREFGLSETRAISAGAKKEKHNAKKWEYQQADRLGSKSPREEKQEITKIYNESKNGAELQANLAKAGYTLAKGDKEGIFLVVNEKGGFSSLTRRVEGTKKADIEAKISDLDRKELPSIRDVREIQKTTKIYNESKNGAELQANLAKAGYTLAKGDKEGIFLVVNEKDGFFSLARRVDGAKEADIKKKLSDLTSSALPSLEGAKELNATLRSVAKGVFVPVEAERPDVKKEYEKSTKNLSALSKEMAAVGGDGFRVTGCTLHIAGKALEKVIDVAEAVLLLLDPPRPREITPQELYKSKEAEKEYVRQLKEKKESNAALGRIAESVRRDQTLSYSDLCLLAREDIEAIKARGDDAVKALCSRYEKEHSTGREMER